MARQPAPAQQRAQGTAGASPCPGWPSHEDVYALREQHGFVTPLKPIEEGKPYCLFAQAGFWEWLFHPADAERHLAEGIVVDGKPCRVEIVGEYPLMGAIQLRAYHEEQERTFVADRAAA